MRSRPPKLARLRLTRRSPAETPAPPEASEGPAGGGYLIVRGESRLETTTRRRLVRTPTTRRPDDPRPAKPARIIGHSPGFRRAVRRSADPTAATAPGADTPPSLQALTTPSPDAEVARTGPGRRRAAAAVLVLVAAVGVFAGAALMLRLPTPAVIPESMDDTLSAPEPAGVLTAPAAAPLPLVPASTAPGPDPQVRLVPPSTRPLGPAADLAAEIVDVRHLPASNVVAVTGTLFNPTVTSLTAIQLEVTLVAGEVALRRRDVFCCDDFGAEALAAVVADATHPHYRSRRGLSTLAVLEPQSSETFVALFPDLPAAGLPAGVLNAGVRVVTGSPAAASPASSLAAGDL